MQLYRERVRVNSLSLLDISATAAGIGGGIGSAGYAMGKGTGWDFNLHWTTAGGGSGTTEYSESELIQKGIDAYDSAVESMRGITIPSVSTFNLNISTRLWMRQAYSLTLPMQQTLYYLG